MGSARGRLGRSGEDLACHFLRSRGLEILARNYRTPFGEVDIVAREGDTLVFVEVRTRRPGAFGPPQESLTPAKRERLRSSALHYIQASGEGSTWRIDLVALEMDRGGALRRLVHIPSAVEG